MGWALKRYICQHMQSLFGLAAIYSAAGPLRKAGSTAITSANQKNVAGHVTTFPGCPSMDYEVKESGPRGL